MSDHDPATNPLRKYRELQGDTQAAAAKACGITGSMLSLYETWRGLPGDDRTAALCLYFPTDVVDDFLEQAQARRNGRLRDQVEQGSEPADEVEANAAVDVEAESLEDEDEREPEPIDVSNSVEAETRSSGAGTALLRLEPRELHEVRVPIREADNSVVDARLLLPVPLERAEWERISQAFDVLVQGLLSD